jgi:hypothetical protein
MNSELNIVFTDVGEEIDDEVAFHVATKTSSHSVWFFVCVPGASSTDPNKADLQVQKRLERFWTLFPFLEPSADQTYYHWTSSIGSTFYVGPPSMMQPPHDFTGLIVDNLIRIAPLWHMDPAYFEQFANIKRYIVMGDLAVPDNSLNLTKAIPRDNLNLRSQYDLQEAVLQGNAKEILSIPTSLARGVPLPYDLVRELPACLSTPILETAFQQCVGRVPAHLNYANNISVVNHKTILAYNPLGVVPDHVRKTIEEQVNRFLESASKDDFDDEAYRGRLQEIAETVYMITGVQYRDGVDFNEENLVDPAKAKANWLAHIDRYNCDLTPGYDLLTLVVKEKGYVPELTECNDSVKAMIDKFKVQD